MIHFFIGTKAQFVKLVPVIKEAERQQLDFRIIDAGFHRGLMDHVVQDFAMPAADVRIGDNEREVRTVPEAIKWFLTTGLRPLLNRRKLFEQAFGSEEGVCVAHGDAPPALVALFHARRCKMPVAHIESGMRSWRYFDPFPEEIIRTIVMGSADILFAPGQAAVEAIEASKTRGQIVNTHWNTIVDTARYAVENPVELTIRGTQEPYCLVTCHRAESVLRRKRMQFVTDLLLRIAEDTGVVFVLHGPTEKYLRKYNLLGKLADHPRIHLSPLLEYRQFASLIHSAQFVITDGGSIQEECAFLGKPCLLVRRHTERPNGLGENVVLSKFNDAIIEDFLRTWPALSCEGETIQLSPAKIIIDALQEHGYC